MRNENIKSAAEDFNAMTMAVDVGILNESPGWKQHFEGSKTFVAWWRQEISGKIERDPVGKPSNTTKTINCNLMVWGVNLEVNT